MASETFLCFKYTAESSSMMFFIKRTMLPLSPTPNTICSAESKSPIDNQLSTKHTSSLQHQLTPYTPCERMHLRSLLLLLFAFLLTTSGSAGVLPTSATSKPSVSVTDIPTALPTSNSAMLAKRIDWHVVWDKIKAEFMNIVNNGK